MLLHRYANPGRFIVVRYDKRGQYEDRAAFFASEHDATRYAEAITQGSGRKATVFEMRERRRVRALAEKERP